MKKIFILFFSIHIINAHQIAIVGCGYVGLTLAGVLLNCGHKITCFDIDNQRIQLLKSQQLPLYEPGLHELIFNTQYTDNILFTTDLNALKENDFFYICVATPTNTHGYCDCSFLQTAFDAIIKVINEDEHKVICVKSTVPPKTIRSLFARLQKSPNIDLVYNPEFMREGSAIQDIYTNNPIILGAESKEAMDKIESLYTKFKNDTMEVIKTNFETAEIIKYAWNSYSALRVTFTNELAYVCRLINADIDTAIKGFTLSEKLLPTSIIKPGPGYGGSCLPKDTLSFAKLLEKLGFTSSLILQAIQSNNNHKQRIIDDILAALDFSHSTPTVTLLGLAFKANTNDVRYAPSIDIIRALREKNIIIKAYDPKAMSEIKALFPDVEYANSAYEAIGNTDCVVILTEWDEFKRLDLTTVAALCNHKVIIDTKNLFNTNLLKQHGFKYVNLGLL